MKCHRLLFLLLPAILGGCLSDGERASSGDSQTAANLPPDSEIISKAYDPSYTVPEDFYVDARAGTSGTYTLYHVKNPSGAYELCTDDIEEAIRLEAADNDSRTVQGALVGILEEDRYYEFLRELRYDSGVGNIPSETSAGFARIFKCAYVDRSGVNRNERSGFQGTLNAESRDAAALRVIDEYLWQFAFFWPSSAKVLESRTLERESASDHSLLLVLVTRQSGMDCDRIDVADWSFSLSKYDGTITADYRVVRTFGARNEFGSPVLCSL